MRKLEFQKIGRINAALFARSAFLRPKIFWILVRLSIFGCPGVSGVFLFYYYWHHIQWNTQLVERDYSLPGTLLAAFAPLGGAWVLFSAQFAADGRLGA